MIPVHTISPVERDRRNLNSLEAPSGYYAFLKYDNPSGANVCRMCDYRQTCLKTQGRCRDYERKDNCSVYFVDISRCK